VPEPDCLLNGFRKQFVEKLLKPRENIFNGGVNMNENQTLFVYCDGGARGNPGPAAYGFVIYDSSRKIIHEEGRAIGNQTNNYAEYSAVIAALKYIHENSLINSQQSEINFFLDSKLVAEQLSGRWKIKNENLRDLFYTVKELEKKTGADIDYKHIPREQNTEADRLVNMALDQE
jgi:ribonuclease HI